VPKHLHTDTIYLHKERCNFTPPLVEDCNADHIHIFLIDRPKKIMNNMHLLFSKALGLVSIRQYHSECPFSALQSPWD